MHLGIMQAERSREQIISWDLKSMQNISLLLSVYPRCPPLSLCYSSATARANCRGMTRDGAVHTLYAIAPCPPPASRRFSIDLFTPTPPSPLPDRRDIIGRRGHVRYRSSKVPRNGVVERNMTLHSTNVEAGWRHLLPPSPREPIDTVLMYTSSGCQVCLASSDGYAFGKW